MQEVWLYSLVSVILVSVISLIGLFTLSIRVEKLRTILIYLISFSAGALFGDAFIHLLPEVVQEQGFGVFAGLSIIGGILIFFILEKVVHWQHCHMPITKRHVHSFAYMNLIGDGLHNYIDGLVIGASYLAGTEIGIATTLAVLLHEIPQEIGDFGVLIHGGFTRGKALFLNFVTAMIAVLGALTALILGEISNIELLILPLTIGGFIYIAGSDLIPELHKETKIRKSLLQIMSFILGIGIMLTLLLLE